MFPLRSVINNRNTMAAYHPAGSAISAAAAAGAAAGAAVVAAATLVAGVAAGAGAEDLYTCACTTCIRSRCVRVYQCECISVCCVRGVLTCV